jgi:hypothetical protein
LLGNGRYIGLFWQQKILNLKKGGVMRCYWCHREKREYEKFIPYTEVAFCYNCFLAFCEAIQPWADEAKFSFIKSEKERR